ncbi:hypothetical protein PV327_000964 [Microctonus hyperodae]|uniref:Death domain-containing protein n=1 Tax=Microctonus hyperodae TaxID=165561 RepID=A0AA39L2U7_MICHY|nr:hypothetical protein PV327_000964 [Microctonus hyperodae]
MSVTMDFFDLWNKYQLEYDRLKQRFIEISTSHISSSCLITLIERYGSSINSKRDADNIKDLCGLLRILENRIVLCYNKIEPLKFIAFEIVNDLILNQIIHEYDINIKSQQTLPLFNVYKCRYTGSAIPKPIQIPTIKNDIKDVHFRNHNVQTASSIDELSTSSHSDKQKMVFDRLSMNLDRYWRDLARFLDVTEFEIDEIDRNTNLQLNDKALKV